MTTLVKTLPDGRIVSVLNVPESDVELYSDHEVVAGDIPGHATHLIGGEFSRVEPPRHYANERVAMYPPIADFLDAWVKNDNAALEDYRQKCLAVKAKHPKP